MGRDAFARQSLGGNLYDRVKKTRVLMVGAGGIGCELLKNLVLINFGEIHVVDLDTIDLSNLNRQFLFRQEHINQPKAVVAKQTASKFNPAVKIVAYHANIKDAQFTKKWFKQFDMVFNALDNMEARRYVNTLCIALDIPLIESGTTGFRGQASVIKREMTECYECVPKEAPKTFPVCTIRSTPSQPIHCIVWAKSYLLAEIFGEGSNDAQELDFSSTEDENSGKELDDIKKETEALRKIRTAIGTEDFARLVFEKVFTADIEVLRSIPERWNAARPAPVALSFDELSNQRKASSILKSPDRDQAVWDLKDCYTMFADSLDRLAKRKNKAKDTVIEFDKDDEDTLEFVSAAANLRSYIFRINAKSKFDIKQMAGNIIPAIATTNAIIAGACVLQAFKVLRGEYTKAKKWYMWQSTDRVMASTFDGPAADCAICSVARTDAVIKQAATLQDLVNALKTIGYAEDDEYSVLVNDQIIFEQGDEDFEENLVKKLSSFSIGGFVAIKSDAKEDLVLSIEEASDSDEMNNDKDDKSTPAGAVQIEPIKVPAKRPKKSEQQSSQASAHSPTLTVRTNGGISSSNGAVSLANGAGTDTNAKKRAAEDELEDGPPNKVQQTVFELDEDGAIVFD